VNYHYEKYCCEQGIYYCLSHQGLRVILSAFSRSDNKSTGSSCTNWKNRQQKSKG